MYKFFLFFILISSVFVSEAFSAVKTWDGGGGDNNLQNSINWVGDIQPFSGDDIVFPASAPRQTINNNYFISTTFRSITFEGGNYTISGNMFQLTNGLIVNAGTQTINAPVSTIAAQTFTAAQNSRITLAVLSVGGELTFDGGFAGSFTIGLISGSGAIVKNGQSGVAIAAAAGYNGAIRINGGSISTDANLSNSSVTVNAPSIITGGGFLLNGIGGSGTIGSTTVNQGFIYSLPFANSNNVLTVQGNLNVGTMGNVSVLVGGRSSTISHSQIKVNGSVILNNALFSIAYSITSPPPLDTPLTIIDNDGTDPINGNFALLPEGKFLVLSGNLAYRVSYVGGDGNDFTITRVARSASDFDGDGRSDISVFRPSNGVWYLNQSSAGFRGTSFGLSSDKLVPADYDGDNKTDIAVFRPSNGYWYILRSSDNTVSATLFGNSDDIPVPGNYDRDGRADIAVFRPSNGTWYQMRSLSNQFFAQQFGQNGDKPIGGDFDGDGLSDLTIYRNGNWYLLESLTGTLRSVLFGLATDQPIPGDFDGDNKTDFAVVRRDANQNVSNFYILRSSDNGFNGLTFGTASDVPAVGDYDGDGRSDVSVFRPSNGVWYLNRSTAGFTGIAFGQNGDQPIPNSY